jgi:hypothetical protein
MKGHLADKNTQSPVVQSLRRNQSSEALARCKWQSIQEERMWKLTEERREERKETGKKRGSESAVVAC